MIRKVESLEWDSWYISYNTLLFDVPSEDFDLVEAVRKAATDFINTPAGRSIYENHIFQFSWADFDANVPQEFCEKYGFRKIDPVAPTIEIDLHEPLVCNSEIEEDDE